MNDSVERHRTVAHVKGVVNVEGVDRHAERSRELVPY
jgi:hypothetical protein